MAKLIRRIDGKWVDAETGEKIWNSLPNDGIVHSEGRSGEPEIAEQNGRAIIISYERQSWPGGMGQLLGITETAPGIYAPVISTYYSPS
ncbi:MAG: hypothetical protein FDZ69_12395 [Deltaproteobacteria bacterium]|nr:MAG: hypothetical protein FDZ69_12395 [Deltaproteobacteria bacterium]